MPTESEIREFIQSIKQPRVLLAMDRFVKEALESLGVSKSKGNPVGEYAEYLVSRAFDGIRMPNAKEGHDISLKDGTKIEVKGRVFEGSRVPMTYIKASTVSANTFDYLVYVVLSENMRVKYAMKISHANFQKLAKYAEPSNAPPKWVFVAKQSLLSSPLVEDVTCEISSIENEEIG